VCSRSSGFGTVDKVGCSGRVGSAAMLGNLISKSSIIIRIDLLYIH